MAVTSNFHLNLLPRTPRAALSRVPPCPIFKVCFFLLVHSGEGIPASLRVIGIKKKKKKRITERIKVESPLPLDEAVWMECSKQIKSIVQTLHIKMIRTDSFEKTLMLGKIEDRRRRGQQRMRWLDGVTDLMDMSSE